MDNTLLVTKKLEKIYSTQSEKLHILRGIDFTMNYGETIAITGESGSGKSTFLNMVAGLDPVSSGKILIENTDITYLNEQEMTWFRNKKIGIIFQQHYLLEEFTALENVMIPFLMNSYKKKQAKEKALHLLNEVRLTGRVNHYPSQLSGGEKQRVAIARAFINTPNLILADEPTGNLDEKTAEVILQLLFTLTKGEQHALILVTHSRQIANMTSRQIHLENGLFTELS